MIKYDEVKRVHIELSSACNAACPQCPRNADGGYTIPSLNVRTMSLGEYKKIFTYEVCNQLEDILMCGNFGDPAYCKDLPDIVRYTGETNPNIKIHVHTNGGIRPPEWWSDLAKTFKNLTVVFSIDGLVDTNHIYRRKVVWDRVMENAQSFNDAGGVSVWEYLIFQHNQHQLDQARTLSEEMNFSEIKFKRPFGFETVSDSYESTRVLKDSGEFDYFIYPADDNNHRNKNFGDKDIDRYGNKLSLPPANFKKLLSNNIQHYDTIFKHEALRYKEQDENEISCMTKNHGEIYIDSAGKVHPCCFLSIGSQNVNLSFDSLQYFKWLENNLEEDQNNAILHSLEDIINSGFLSKIEQTWSKTHEEGRMMCCTQMCSKNKSAKDKLYI